MDSAEQKSGKVKSKDEFTSPFSNVKLFRKKKNNNGDIFGVEFEESREISSDSLAINKPISILTQKYDATIPEKSYLNKKASLFSQKKNTVDAFDVSFEMSTNLTQASSISLEDKNETLSQNSTTSIKRPDLFKNIKNMRDSLNSEFDKLSQSQTISQKSNDFKEILSQDSTNLTKCKLFNQRRKNNNNNFDMEFEKSSQTLSQESTKSSQQSQQLLSDDSTHFMKPKLFENKKRKGNNAYNTDFEKSSQKSVEDFSQGSQESHQLSSSFQKPDESLSQNIEKQELFKNRKRQKIDPFDIDFEESNQCLTVKESQDEETSNVNKLIPFNSQRKQKDDPFDIDFEESKTFTETSNTLPVQRTIPFKPLRKETDENFDVNFDETNVDDSVTVAHSQNLFRRNEKSQDFQISLNGSVDESGSVIDPKRDSSHTSIHKKEFEEFEQEKEPIVKEQRLEKSITDVKKLEYSLENTKGMTNENVPEVPSFLNESSFNDENLNGWASDCLDDEPEDVPDKNSAKDPSPIQNDQAVEDEESAKEPSPFQNDQAVEDEDSAKEPSPIQNDQAIEDEDNLENEFQLKLNNIINNARKIARKDESVIFSKPEKVEKSKKDKDKDKDKDKFKFKNSSHYKKPRLAKPAPFANKRLYEYIMKKIKPKYGLDYVLKAEEMVVAICDVVKIVNRRKTYQKKLINDLKLDMAKMGLIETTFDFHEFVRNYLPYEFREKVVPCIQPGSNIIYPPKDAKNPFDKILP